MGPRIAIMGAGAVGGYVGGLLAQAGHDVTLLDPWPEHVEAIRAHGLAIEEITPEDSCTVRVDALHLTELQGFSQQRPVDIAALLAAELCMTFQLDGSARVRPSSKCVGLPDRTRR